MSQSQLTTEDGLREVARWTRLSGDDSVVVGVGGKSCAGKSAVSTALRDRILDSGIFEMDAYYHFRLDRGEPGDVNFDEPHAMDFNLLK